MCEYKYRSFSEKGKIWVIRSPRLSCFAKEGRGRGGHFANCTIFVLCLFVGFC